MTTNLSYLPLSIPIANTANFRPYNLKFKMAKKRQQRMKLQAGAGTAIDEFTVTAGVRT